MPDNNEGGWLRRRLSQPTSPGVSVRDGVTRFGTFFHKPGDSRWRNAGRIARAIGIGIVAGPGGVFGAASRHAAQGEAREGLTHVARTAWERMRGGGQGDPAPSEGPSGRTWPTNMGPPPSLAGVPGYTPRPGMGIMPSPQGSSPPPNPWTNNGQPSVPRYSWEETPAEEPPLYGNGQGMMRPEGSGAPGGQRPSLDAFMVMREAPGAAAILQHLAAMNKPRNIEK